MQSYDYAHRKGVRPLSWEDVAAMAATLSERLALEGVDLVVGIARAGLIPAVAVASVLRLELYPIRLTRRVNDEIVHSSPVWRVPVPGEVTGKTVALVDEIADTGETLRLAADEARRMGARRVVTASLVSHTWASPAPDVAVLVTDELVLFPWDRRVLAEGQWQFNPELIEALAAQDLAPGETNPA